MSALTFGAATSDRIDCGSAAALDDLATLTVCAAVYLTTHTNGRFIAAKAGFLQMGADTASGANNIRFYRERATTNTTYRTNTGVLTTGQWHFVAWTFDSGATPQVRIYHSTQGGAVTEQTYGTSTDGTGALASDAALSFVWGNTGSGSPAQAIQGDLAYGQLYNRVLSVPELTTIKTTWRPLDGCLVFTKMGANGTGTQRNERSSSHTGTVTGATLQSARSYPVNPFMAGGLRGFAAVVSTLKHSLIHGHLDGLVRA